MMISKRKLLALCFLLVWIVTSSASAGFGFFAESYESMARGALNTILSWVFGLDPDYLNNNARIGALQREEERRVHFEDQGRNRVLQNNLYTYHQISSITPSTTPSRETIELRVTPTRVRPGETVWFEAIPSPETPDLGPRLGLRLGAQNFNFATLRRGWFENIYRGSLRMGRFDAAAYTVRIVTPHGHHSNSVTVVVAPDCSQLSWITVHQRRISPLAIRIGITEGATTSPPISLRAEGIRGERFFLSSPALGIYWTIDDENIAQIVEERVNGIVLKGISRGGTRLRARYGSLEAEAIVIVGPREIPPMTSDHLPRPEPPRQLTPPDGFIGRAGERIQLEATPLDSSKGHTFTGSYWRVYMLHPLTGQRISGASAVASLRNGRGERAEWTPPGPGVFEWRVAYGFTGDYYWLDPQGRSPRRRRRQVGGVRSSYQRIVVVDRYEITSHEITQEGEDYAAY